MESSKHIAIQYTLYPTLAIWQLPVLFGELRLKWTLRFVSPEEGTVNSTLTRKGKTRERKWHLNWRLHSS